MPYWCPPILVGDFEDVIDEEESDNSINEDEESYVTVEDLYVDEGNHYFCYIMINKLSIVLWSQGIEWIQDSSRG